MKYQMLTQSKRKAKKLLWYLNPCNRMTAWKGAQACFRSLAGAPTLRKITKLFRLLSLSKVWSRCKCVPIKVTRIPIKLICRNTQITKYHRGKGKMFTIRQIQLGWNATTNNNSISIFRCLMLRRIVMKTRTERQCDSTTSLSRLSPTIFTLLMSVTMYRAASPKGLMSTLW